MRKLSLCFGVLVLAAIPFSCSKDKAEKEVVGSLTGKEIVLPESLDWRIIDETVDPGLAGNDYTIVTYLDSTGCTECRMKLPVWDNIINEFKRNPDISVGFLMILDSDRREEISRVLRKNNFLHPVTIDSLGVFRNANSLPEDSRFHTFLLDSERKVIAIGNPVFNPKIREFFHRSIKEDSGIDTAIKDAGICSAPARSAGAVASGDTLRLTFRLKNPLDKEIRLQEAVPSCGCVSVSTSSDRIEPAKFMTVTVSYVADTVAGPFLQYSDIFFKELSDPQHLIINGFITK